MLANGQAVASRPAAAPLESLPPVPESADELMPDGVTPAPGYTVLIRTADSGLITIAAMGVSEEKAAEIASTYCETDEFNSLDHDFLILPPNFMCYLAGATSLLKSSVMVVPRELCEEETAEELPWWETDDTLTEEERQVERDREAKREKRRAANLKRKRETEKAARRQEQVTPPAPCHRPGLFVRGAKKALPTTRCLPQGFKSAPRWTRTNNPLIKSQMLCQLS
jgi:hypothetical protein